MAEIRNTPLLAVAQELKAHLVDFAGWRMPIYFESIIQEQRAVRENAGLFDVSHMGKLRISGGRSAEFISRLTCNDPEILRPGQIQYSMVLNPAGGVKDDILVYRFEKYFLLVVNAVNTPKIREWFNSENREKVLIEDLTAEMALVALQGPQAEKVIFEIFGPAVKKIFYYHFLETETLGQKIILSRTGYTGEDGFEIFCPAGWADRLWQLIMEKSGEYKISPCGLGARDILRIEAALPLYGHELSEEISPLETGFGWTVKFSKNDFIGRSALEAKGQEPAGWKLGGLIIEENIIPRQGNKIFLTDSEESIGEITSGTFSPSLKLPVAMAFLKPAEIKIGNPVKISIRDRLVPARVVALPFYRHRTKKFKEVK